MNWAPTLVCLSFYWSVCIQYVSDTTRRYDMDVLSVSLTRGRSFNLPSLTRDIASNNISTAGNLHAHSMQATSDYQTVARNQESSKPESPSPPELTAGSWSTSSSRPRSASESRLVPPTAAYELLHSHLHILLNVVQNQMLHHHHHHSHAYQETVRAADQSSQAPLQLAHRSLPSSPPPRPTRYRYPTLYRRTLPSWRHWGASRAGLPRRGPCGGWR